MRKLYLLHALTLVFSSLLLVSVSTAAVYTDCGVADCQTVEPLVNQDPLLTAGQGIVQAIRWNPTTWYNSRTHTLANNPTWDDKSVVREMRIGWDEIEPTKGHYDFAALKAAIDAGWAATPRKQTIVRIIGYNPKNKAPPNPILDPVPAWFKTAAKARGPQCTGIGTAPTFAGTPRGCTWYETRYNGSCAAGEQCTKLFAPNVNEPPANGESFQERALAFIAAFKTAFDTADYRHKLFAVDLGWYGQWGELETTQTLLQNSNLNWPAASEAYGKALVDAWWTLPDSIQVTTNFQFAWETGRVGNSRFSEPKTGWLYACEKALVSGRPAGWRNDGLDKPGISGTGWVILPALASSSALAQCWQQGAVNGEPMRQWGPSDEGNMVGALDWWAGTEPYLYKGNYYPPAHGTLFNAKWVAFNTFSSEQQAALKAWPGRVGYRLAPTLSIFPTTARAKDRWNLVVELKNVGTGHFQLRGYTAKVRFHSLSGIKQDLELPIDLNQLTAGQALTAIKTELSLAPGTWDVNVGIGPAPGIGDLVPVLLAVKDRQCVTELTGTQWCSLGAVTITP